MNYGRRFVTLYRRQGSRLSPWGIGMGNTCKPMAVSFQCMTKSTTIKIIIIIKNKLHIQKMNIMSFGPIISGQIDGETMEAVRDVFFFLVPLLQMITSDMKLKDLCSFEKKIYDKPIEMF